MSFKILTHCFTEGLNRQAFQFSLCILKFLDSLFGDAHNSTSTPSKHQDLDSSISGNMASYRNVTDQDITNSGLGWNKNDHHFDDDRSSLSNDDGGDGLYHRSDYAELPASTFERGISSQNSARTTDSAGSSIRAGQSHTTKVEDDWRLFRPASSPMSSATASGSLSESTKGQDLRNKWGEASHLNTVTNTDEDDWCDFSAASAGSGVTKAGAPGGGTEEAEVVGSSENIVTIKKQNLGTSEIMGLFKVRDDPATLSSYQLPTQPQTSKSASRCVLLCFLFLYCLAFFFIFFCRFCIIKLFLCLLAVSIFSISFLFGCFCIVLYVCLEVCMLSGCFCLVKLFSCLSFGLKTYFLFLFSLFL